MVHVRNWFSIAWLGNPIGNIKIPRTQWPFIGFIPLEGELSLWMFLSFRLYLYAHLFSADKLFQSCLLYVKGLFEDALNLKKNNKDNPSAVRLMKVGRGTRRHQSRRRHREGAPEAWMEATAIPRSVHHSVWVTDVVRQW